MVTIMITTKDTALIPYKEFWVKQGRKDNDLFWIVSTKEFMTTAKVWHLNAYKLSLNQAIEYVYKDIQEDLKNWDKLSNEMQGYYLEKFPDAVMPILIKRYIKGGDNFLSYINASK